MNAHTKIAPAYLARAQSDSASEAAAWVNTPLAKWIMERVNQIELWSDELAGIKPHDSEKDGYSMAHDALSGGLHDLRFGLENMRDAAIAEASAGYDDEDFEDELERDTPTVPQALALYRRGAVG